MNQTMKRRQVPGWVRTLLFCLVGLILFLCVQRLLSYKRISAKHTVEGFQALERDSHMARGVSPMRLYEKYHIVSYNLATDNQTMELSLFLLEQIFRTQSPQAVVFDVSGLFFKSEAGYDEENGAHYNMKAGLEYVDTLFPLSGEKVRLLKNYQAMARRSGAADADQKADDVMLSSLVPMARYHERWQELSGDDFLEFLPMRNYYTAGQCFQAEAKAVGYSLKRINDTAAMMADEGLYESQIPEENMAILRQMKELCEKNSCELILTKVPVYAMPNTYSSAWPEVRSKAVEEAAGEENLMFLDLVYQADLGLDLARDTMDGGRHLNYRGAEKTADYYGQVLAERYGLAGKIDERYEDNMPVYREIRKTADLENEQDFCAYMKLLRENADQYTIVLAVQNDLQEAITEEQKAALAALKLKTVWDESMQKLSYGAVIHRGKVIFEKSSVDPVTYVAELDCGKTLSVLSKGYLSVSSCHVEVDGEDYALNFKGLNVIVLDADSGLAVDSVVFDPAGADPAGFRDPEMIKTLIAEYERARMFPDAGDDF